jgi:predicted Ser/Thr protein kinase
MNVLAFSIPGHPDWRWRIVDYDGKTVEESSTAFTTMAEALAEGRERFHRHVEREVPTVRRRW